MNSIRPDNRQLQMQQLNAPQDQQQLPGGRFDFEDGGSYCGGWEDGKATGHGICTGPRSQGEYAGSWHLGFEVSGCYTWPSGNTYSGQWQNGKRQGLGVETRGRWIYRGEWTQGQKGRYGTRCSLTSGAKYEGTFSAGLQDGYGQETYADGGTYQGQWQKGLRHGYGIRVSASFATASLQRKKSLHSQPSITPVEPTDQKKLDEEHEDPVAERDHKMEQERGGFILKAHSEEPTVEKKRKTFAERKDLMKNSITSVLRFKKQHSTGDIDHKTQSNHVGSHGSLRSARSNSSFNSSQDSGGMTHAASEGNVSFISQDELLDPNVTETFMGEWKHDKRSGFGVAERSDGLKYEGEWHNNKKYGYGVTYFKDGGKEEGKYKNNILVSSQKKKGILVRASKLREKIDQAVSSAQRAAQIALQKADISMNRTSAARGKAEQAEIAAMNAKEDAEIARSYASQFSPYLRQGDPTQPQFHSVISQVDAMAPNRAQYGYKKPAVNITNVTAEIGRARSSTMTVDEDTPFPSGIAARVGGRLTVDDSYAAEPGGSRRPSIQHLGDEDFAPEQFLNRSSPRNLSVRGSIRSHRSTRTNDESHKPRSTMSNQRRTDHGTATVMTATMMELPGEGVPHLGATNRGLPVPELKYTETGSPYYTATPNPAMLTPIHVNNQIGTPEYMQQVADRLQQNSLRPNHYGPTLVDSGTSTQQYQPFRAIPQPQIQVNRRSTLPAALAPEALQAPVPPKPPRTPQAPLTAIHESRNGSTGSSLNTRGMHHSPSESTMPTKVSLGTLPRQPSQDVPSSMSSQNPVTSSRGVLSQRNPTLGKIPKLGSINMGGSIRVSMPDIFAATTLEAPPPLSREEVSRLSSERREAVRRLRDEEERMKRNPLLYIFHPAVKEFFRRYYVIIFVALLNIIFFYLLFVLLYG